jgi:predicted permease
VNTFSLDVRYGWRRLLTTPIASIIAVLSLAAGIGVTSTVWSVFDGLFFRPLACHKPREIVRVNAGGFSYPEYEEFRRQCQRLSGVLAETGHGAILQDREQSQFVLASTVSPNFFSVLGIRPSLGEFFAERPGAPETEPVMVISEGLWRRFFASDVNVIGRSVELSDRPVRIVGVAPAGFKGVDRQWSFDVWYPEGTSPSRDASMLYSFRAYTVMGRLAPGVRAKEAQAEAETIVRRVMPGGVTRQWDQPVRIQSEMEYGWEQGGLMILIVMPVVGLVLLVACANVSGLLLARNEQRRRELAVRSALGATRLRLIRQLLTESMLLAAGGMLLAMPLTLWAVRPVSRLILGPGSEAVDHVLTADHRVLVVTSLLTLASTVMAGLLPAIRSARVDLSPVLKGDVPVVGVGRWRLAGRHLLVVGQLSMSVVFLAATGLLAVGFFSVLRLDPGFTTRELLVVNFFGLHDREPELTRGYYRALIERLEALPGVLRVSMAVAVPYIEGQTSLARTVYLPVVGAGERRPGFEVRANIVEPNYFKTLGIRQVRGRDFRPEDDARSPLVVIVDETLARRLWPGEDPLGKTLRVGTSASESTVIGVVGDIRQAPMEEQRQPFVYVAFRQETETYAHVLMATSGKAGSIINLVRNEMRALDPEIVPWRTQTLEEGMWRRTSNAWALVGLMSTLCAMIFLLSVAGLYGLVAYSVACRTQEFGIRMALGARRSETLKLVMRHGLGLAVVGAGLGVMFALAAGGLLRSNLPGVPGTHGWILMGSAGVVVLVVMLACLVPARQAMRIDPLEVLRCDR